MIEFLTTILVLVTVYYAWQTHRTVKVMEETNEANNRPVISIELGSRPEGVSFMDLVIRNSGNGLARDIKFLVRGDEIEVENLGDRKAPLDDVYILKNGIKTLAPSEARSVWLLSVMGRVDEVLAKDVRIAVSYKNGDFSKSYDDEFTLDFASMPRIELGHDPLHNMDKELTKLRKAVEGIGEAVKR